MWRPLPTSSISLRALYARVAPSLCTSLAMGAKWPAPTRTGSCSWTRQLQKLRKVGLVHFFSTIYLLLLFFGFGWSALHASAVAAVFLCQNSVSPSHSFYDVLVLAADPNSSLDAVISLLRAQLTEARALSGQEGPIGSVNVFLDACRSHSGLATTSVELSGVDRYAVSVVFAQPFMFTGECELRCGVASLLAPSRVSVTVGFAAGSGAQAFESDTHPLSFYTQALVTSIDAHGHMKDTGLLLKEVCANVVAVTSAMGAIQTPCVYDANTGSVVLVSLVATVPLSAGATSTVGDAARPLLDALVAQVSERIGVSHDRFLRLMALLSLFSLNTRFMLFMSAH
jgi:hypothetical protein